MIMRSQMNINDPTRTPAPADLVTVRNEAITGQRGHMHRFEVVGEVDGCTYVNDSASTFLDAALESLSRVQGRVVWICGMQPMSVVTGDMLALVQDKVEVLVVFGEQGSEVGSVPDGTDPTYYAKELRTAVFLAHELAQQGQTVLFSPACPSGHGFANYEERGMEFKRAVKDL